MKTILHISKYYYPDLGGIESVARQVVGSLHAYRNIVVCFSTDGQSHQDVVDGVMVHRIAAQFSIMSQDIAFGYRRNLRQLMDKYAPDIVHVHCPNPFVYPLICGALRPETKLVVHWHSDILSKGLMYKLIRPFEQRFLERANVILATSPNYIEASQPLKPHRSKIQLLPNGIQTPLFEKQPADEPRIADIRQQWPGKKLVLFVGRHVYYKGIDRLIAAEAFIQSDVQILIAGTGPLSTNYRRLAQDHDRITFLGRLSDTDLRRYLWAADIFGFASINKAEAFGVALAEAMYCQAVPVVFHLEGSGVNWVSLKDQTGLEVPNNDLQAYAAAIDTLCHDDALRERCAHNARQRVLEQFSEKAITQTTQQIYSAI